MALVSLAWVDSNWLLIACQAGSVFHMNTTQTDLLNLINNPHLIPTEELPELVAKCASAGLSAEIIEYAIIVVQVQTTQRKRPVFV